MDLALDNLQRLICHKTEPTKPDQTFRLGHSQFEIGWLLGYLMMKSVILIFQIIQWIQVNNTNST